MAPYSAVFVKIDGLDETDLGCRDLKADTLEEATKEALTYPLPAGANFIKILQEGRYVHKVGVDL
jgi:hypothetical protein